MEGTRCTKILYSNLYNGQGTVLEGQELSKQQL